MFFLKTFLAMEADEHYIEIKRIGDYFKSLAISKKLLFDRVKENKLNTRMKIKVFADDESVPFFKKGKFLKIFLNRLQNKKFDLIIDENLSLNKQKGIVIETAGEWTMRSNKNKKNLSLIPILRKEDNKNIFNMATFINIFNNNILEDNPEIKSNLFDLKTKINEQDMGMFSLEKLSAEVGDIGLQAIELIELTEKDLEEFSALFNKDDNEQRDLYLDRIAAVEEAEQEEFKKMREQEREDEKRKQAAEWIENYKKSQQKRAIEEKNRGFMLVEKTCGGCRSTKAFVETKSIVKLFENIAYLMEKRANEILLKKGFRVKFFIPDTFSRHFYLSDNNLKNKLLKDLREGCPLIIEALLKDEGEEYTALLKKESGKENTITQALQDIQLASFYELLNMEKEEKDRLKYMQIHEPQTILDIIFAYAELESSELKILKKEDPHFKTIFFADNGNRIDQFKEEEREYLVAELRKIFDKEMYVVG